MRKTYFFTRWLPAILLIGSLAFAGYTVIIWLLWPWVVPDLFPGAVSSGLIAASLSWTTAMKTAVTFAILTMVFRNVHNRQ